MELTKKIAIQNVHWQNGKFETFPFKRDLFENIWRDIDTKLIELVTGPRRTGKSVILKQIINDLISKKSIKSSQILFFEFSSKDKQDKIWSAFNYFKEEIADPRLPTYLFFDEIQYIDGYEVVVKEIYDNVVNCKIFITGSLSLSYKRRMQDSLAGRFFTYKLFPLSFSEYLKFKQNDVYQLFLDIKNETEHLQLKTDKFKLSYKLDLLNAEFRNFLLYGRFPELISLNDDQSKAYLYNIVNQSLNQDAFSYFDIEKPVIINSLFDYFRANNGSLISINKLSSQIETTNQTVSLYIDILQQMNLIYIIYNSTNPLIRLNVAKKIYVNSSFGLLDSKLDHQTSFGFAVESYILERLLERNEMVTFYRNRDREVDFLLPNKNIGYEVKFRHDPPKIKISLKNYKLEVVSINQNLPACLF